VLPEGIETHTGTVTGSSTTVSGVTLLQTETVNGVRWLTIDRPRRKNAIPPDGWQVLAAAFGDFEDSADRVLVITGADGDFCAGADLGADTADAPLAVTDAHRRMKQVERTATALHRLTKPTIAAVDGVAVGAGMNLALGCDVVIATTRARFAEIFVRRGLTVDFGGTWLLPRIVGLQRAKELALSGRIVEAGEAVSLGLAMEAVEVEELTDRVTDVARSFLAGAPIGQMFAKQGLNASFESSFAESISWESQSQAIALGTEDAIEGVAAFLGKRDPEWRGR
jgi:enoyl-CoA hydratase/carnithine racemase